MIMQTTKTSRESNPTPSNAHHIGIQSQCAAAVQALLKTTKEAFLQGTQCSPLDHCCYGAENLGSMHPNILFPRMLRGWHMLVHLVLVYGHIIRIPHV